MDAGDSDVSDATSATEDDGGAEGCPPTNGDEDSECVRRAIGRFVDENGNAPADVELVSVCGPVCFAGDIEANGRFAVNIGARLDADDYSVLLHGRPRYAGYYFPVPPLVEGVFDLGDLLVFTLPDSGAAIAVSGDAQRLESGDLTLLLPPDATARFDFEALGGGTAGTQFRARRIPIAAARRLGHVPQGAVAVFALGPYETYFFLPEAIQQRLSVGLSVARDDELSAFDRYDVFVLGSYLYPDYVRPAAFEKVATLAPSEDGARLETPQGEGVELLTWLVLVPSSN